jgi:hypothetical protein
MGRRRGINVPMGRNDGKIYRGCDLAECLWHADYVIGVWGGGAALKAGQLLVGRP